MLTSASELAPQRDRRRSCHLLPNPHLPMPRQLHHHHTGLRSEVSFARWIRPMFPRLHFLSPTHLLGPPPALSVIPPGTRLLLLTPTGPSTLPVVWLQLSWFQGRVLFPLCGWRRVCRGAVVQVLVYRFPGEN